MKTPIKILIHMVVITFSCLSCDNLIEPDDPTNQISSTEVFNNVNTADAVLSNLYAELQYNSLISGGSRGLGALLGSYADDLDSYQLP